MPAVSDIGIIASGSLGAISAPYFFRCLLRDKHSQGHWITHLFNAILVAICVVVPCGILMDVIFIPFWDGIDLCSTFTIRLFCWN